MTVRKNSFFEAGLFEIFKELSFSKLIKERPRPQYVLHGDHRLILTGQFHLHVKAAFRKRLSSSLAASSRTEIIVLRVASANILDIFPRWALI